MKKYYLILIILVLCSLFISIPPYIECSQLTIISQIEVRCDSNYEILYREVIPVKKNNGITYQYKDYTVTDKELLHGIYLLEKGKHIYKEKAKYRIDCPEKDKIIKIIKET